mgnify:CR=1 FL=1
MIVYAIKVNKMRRRTTKRLQDTNILGCKVRFRTNTAFGGVMAFVEHKLVGSGMTKKEAIEDINNNLKKNKPIFERCKK